MKPKRNHCYGHTPPNTKGAKTPNSGVERNTIRYTPFVPRPDQHVICCDVLSSARHVRAHTYARARARARTHTHTHTHTHESERAAFFLVASGACSGRLGAPLWSHCRWCVSLTVCEEASIKSGQCQRQKQDEN